MNIGRPAGGFEDIAQSGADRNQPLFRFQAEVVSFKPNSNEDVTIKWDGSSAVLFHAKTDAIQVRNALPHHLIDKRGKPGADTLPWP